MREQWPKCAAPPHRSPLGPAASLAPQPGPQQPPAGSSLSSCRARGPPQHLRRHLPPPELIRCAVCTSLPSDVLLDLHESFADRPVSVGILGAGQAEGVLQSMLQRGQGLLLLLQTSLVHLGLSQKLPRFLGGEAHGGGIGDVSLKTGQEAATLLYLKKAG